MGDADNNSLTTTATEWVVECSVCRRPFVVVSSEMPWAGRDFIRVPAHEIPGLPRSRCMGCDETGFFITARSDYSPRGKAKALLRKHPEYRP